MTGEKEVYVAGVGLAPSKGGDALASLVSAATKALLDAGLNYDDVTHGVRSEKTGPEAFTAFDEDGVALKEVSGGSELDTSFDMIKNQGAQCVLLVTSEKSNAVALVLVSGKKLLQYSFLKDSSVLLSKSGSSQKQSDSGLSSICQPVWTLRGWSDKGDSKNASFQNYKLSRADSQDVPKWKDVEHKQDGKFRLRHNPVKENKETFHEDFEAVRAAGKNRNKTADKLKFKKVGGDRAALAKL